MKKDPSPPELQSTTPHASPIEKQPRIFQEVIGILRIGSVARIRVHDELGIGEMLSEKERIDRLDDDVLASVEMPRNRLSKGNDLIEGAMM